MDDYEKYRGKCKEFCENLIEKNPNLKIVRGYYIDPLMSKKEPHWWCVDKDGVIIDPTKKQFPSGGMFGSYEEFDGFFDCSECGKKFPEKEVVLMGNGNYQLCSEKCAAELVGMGEYYIK